MIKSIIYGQTHTHTEMERKTCTKMNFDQSIDHQVGWFIFKFKKGTKIFGAKFKKSENHDSRFFLDFGKTNERKIKFDNFF